ncbi:DUF4391 domain-containing protein [Azospirillum sp. 412522]|nr:DUF4391 domain-containing protein [Azospirillum sp. 412522]MBY6260842.1 DUF4391 domain-containing protein [Azospirillum sp. 412522]
MTLSRVIDALELPDGARLDLRVAKKELLSRAPTAADKRLIQNGVDDVVWVAALKPVTIGVPDYRDSDREYLEIAVLTATLRPEVKAPRLIELIHRAIPYPVLLATLQEERVTVSTAPIRWSQGETGKTVTEEVTTTTAFRPDAPDSVEAAFLASLPLSVQPSRDLRALYQGWIDRIAALAAARLSGAFRVFDSVEQAERRRAALIARDGILRELQSLRARATKERQLGRRVEINIAIRRLETDLAALAADL